MSMQRTIVAGLLITLVSLSGFAQTTKKEAPRPEIGKYCKVYRAGEGLKVLILRVGPEANNESLVCTDGFDHPWDGKIFKAKVVKADGRQEFTIQNNGRPFVVLVFREKYGQSLLYVQADFFR